MGKSLNYLRCIFFFGEGPEAQENTSRVVVQLRIGSTVFRQVCSFLAAPTG